MAYTLDDIGNAPGQAYDWAKRQFISLTKPSEDDGDYTTRSAAIARQQKMAEALSQMGNQEQAVYTAGGITAPMSPMGALARGLTSFGGSYLSGKAAGDEAALKKGEISEAKDYYAGLRNKPAPYTLPGEGGAAPMDLNIVDPVTGKAAMTTAPRSMQEQRDYAAEARFSDNPMIRSMADSLEARATPKFANLGARGAMDTNPDSPTYGKIIGAPPKDLEAPKTAGGLQWTPDKGWTEIPGYTEQAKQLAEARHITIENSNNAKLSPDDLDFMARQALTGDTSVFAGLGYGSAGAQNRSLLRSKITQVAKEQGIKPADVAALNAQFFGTKAGERTLGTRTANIGMAVAEATQLMPLALAASEKVNRTQFPTLNSILMAGEKGVGDENVVRLGIATNSLINTYARAINPTGIPTVSDKDHARELLVNAWSKGQYAAGVNQLKLEMDAAKQSPGIVREEFRTSISGTTPASKQGGGGGKTKTGVAFKILGQ
jgi:hypothetical protein